MSGRDVTEAIQWIKEKEPQLTSEDYGKDLFTSEALFHSHKGLERNLAVMDDKVSPSEEYLTPRARRGVWCSLRLSRT